MATPATKSDLSKTHYIVIGGGLLGLASARALAIRGAKVTVIEMGAVGKACSFGNAGWLTPCFALPLPQPGLFWSSLKWLLDSESPLHIQPRMSLTLFHWLFRFMRSMNQKHLMQSTDALIQLSNLTLELIQHLKPTPADDFRKNGLLMISATTPGLEATLAEMNLVSKFGVRGQQLTPSEIRQLEPAVTAELTGGVYFPDEAQIEPYQLSLHLKRDLESHGVPILENTVVHSFKTRSLGNSEVVESVETSKGSMNADEFVLATGSWSEGLGKNLGLKIPVLGGKGYSMLVPTYPDQPQLPIMVLERKIAITPRLDGVRLAGTLELVRNDSP
ncbi:MAG: FAD-dependent oxidoreductase, partial [Bdellovibrionales bacterium]|nr:FAD-dependent oxidoreductase [Bdellovibrionales bacterium]